MVHNLISSYGLLKYLQVLPVTLATADELASFHSNKYLSYLKKTEEMENFENALDAEEFNLEYDCPVFPNIYQFAKIIAGASLTAAKQLTPNGPSTKIKTNYNPNPSSCLKPKSYLKYTYQTIPHSPINVYNISEDLSFEENECKILDKQSVEKESNNQLIAINWCGGWHHAQRDGAEGFCYVNDIVIAINYLLKFYQRILYVDLDIHHGNGVENAFIETNRVMTFSLHKYMAGYYPNSGDIDSNGIGSGRFCTVNVPLKDGITDKRYCHLFSTIADHIRKVYSPDCLVVQCGADALTDDPLGGFNLTPKAPGNCVQCLLNWKLPTLILGGGGYNLPNAAKCFTYLTSVIVGVTISNDIPEHEFFNLYGPGFELEINASYRKDENSDEELNNIESTILRAVSSNSDGTMRHGCIGQVLHFLLAMFRLQ